MYNRILPNLSFMNMYIDALCSQWFPCNLPWKNILFAVEIYHIFTSTSDTY